MPLNRTLPECFKVVTGTTPVTTNGAVATDYVSCKDANMLYAVCHMTQAVGHATVLAPYQATDVSGTGAKVLGTAVPIWANEATGTNDTLVAQTAAVNYSVTADIANKMVIFQIDPASLDQANSFDCIKITASDSSQATNLISVVFYVDTAYKQATPPTAITD